MVFEVMGSNAQGPMEKHVHCPAGWPQWEEAHSRHSTQEELPLGSQSARGVQIWGLRQTVRPLRVVEGTLNIIKCRVAKSPAKSSICYLYCTSSGHMLTLDQSLKPEDIPKG